jgi:hypothetical protein
MVTKDDIKITVRPFGTIEGCVVRATCGFTLEIPDYNSSAPSDVIVEHMREAILVNIYGELKDKLYELRRIVKGLGARSECGPGVLEELDQRFATLFKMCEGEKL